MALKLRLARGGSKKRPYYHVVVADARSPRDGRFIERLGHWNPMQPKESGERVGLNEERIKHWLDQGAQPTDRVLRFLDEAGLAKRDARSNPKKGEPGQKAKERAEERAQKEEERRQAEADAAEEAKAAAAAAAETAGDAAEVATDAASSVVDTVADAASSAVGAVADAASSVIEAVTGGSDDDKKDEAKADEKSE